MKLAALTSGLRPATLPASAGSAHADEVKVHRIEALDSISPDRKRSLQQEMAEIEPNAIGQFHGSERILANARELAAALTAELTAELTALPDSLSRLVKADHDTRCLPHIDDAA